MPKRVDTFAVIQHATTEAVQLGTIGTDYFPDLTTPDLEHTTPFQQPDAPQYVTVTNLAC